MYWTAGEGYVTKGKGKTSPESFVDVDGKY
jgi:hypothetical protein